MSGLRHPACPPEGTRLCAWDAVPTDGGLEVLFGSADEPLRLVVLRRGDEAVCFVNLCPHFSLPLNHEPGHFLVFEGAVVCAHHTAFFRLADGLCTEGPCLGMSLVELPVHREAEGVRLGQAPGLGAVPPA